MIKTFTIKLDTQITIDFSSWGLSDAQQRGGNETRKLVMEQFLEQNGLDEFEISQKNGSSLFEDIAKVVKAENDYFLMHKNEF